MTEYYFDIETTGFCPNFDRVLTIQYQELDRETAKPVGDLIILKEWQTSEKKIIEEFLGFSKLHCSENHAFHFIPVGDNLTFDLLFLQQRVKRLLNFQIPTWWLLHQKPKIDIRSILVLTNYGQFLASGLDQVVYNRQSQSVKVPEWYKNRQYNEITEYIKQEAKDFIQFYQILRQKLPALITKEAKQ